jgi:hypothetical protein
MISFAGENLFASCLLSFDEAHVSWVSPGALGKAPRWMTVNSVEEHSSMKSEMNGVCFL